MRGVHGITERLELSTTAKIASRPDRVPLGIAFMLGATVMFSVSSALSKWQVADYSFAEVLFFRAVGSLGTIALMILPRTGLRVFYTKRLRDHFGRSTSRAANLADVSLVLIIR